MNFFDDLGKLMKKYNLEIRTFHLEENIKIMNDRLHLALRPEDLPPPVILFRTNEGDFVPTVFDTITLNNEERNFHFIDISNNKVFDIFPVKNENTEAPAEEVKTEEPKEDPKVEEELTPEQEQQVVETLNKLSEAIQMDWSDVPQKKEEKVDEKKEQVVKETQVKPIQQDVVEENVEIVKEPKKKYVYNPTDKFYIVGSMFKKVNCNSKKFDKFIEKHLDKLQLYGSTNGLVTTVVNEEIYKNGNIKISSDEGKNIIEKAKEEMKNYDVIICLKGWDKASEAKALVEYAKEKGKTIITEDEF